MSKSEEKSSPVLVGKVSVPVDCKDVLDESLFVQYLCFDQVNKEIYVIGGNGPGGNSRSVFKFDEGKGMIPQRSMKTPNGVSVRLNIFSHHEGRKMIYSYGCKWSGGDRGLSTYDFEKKYWSFVEMSEPELDDGYVSGMVGGIARTEKGMFLALIEFRNGFNESNNFILHEIGSQHREQIPVVQPEGKCVYSGCVVDNYIYILRGDNFGNLNELPKFEFCLFRCDIHSSSLSDGKKWEKISDFPDGRIIHAKTDNGTLYRRPQMLVDQKRKRIIFY